MKCTKVFVEALIARDCISDIVIGTVYFGIMVVIERAASDEFVEIGMGSGRRT